MWVDGGTCRNGKLCPNCNAILILKAACLGVADRLNTLECFTFPAEVQGAIAREVGRLRADVARVEG